MRRKKEKGKRERQEEQIEVKAENEKSKKVIGCDQSGLSLSRFHEIERVTKCGIGKCKAGSNNYI